MKQTEKKVRTMLSKLPDRKLRKLAEGIELSPFPVLINKEYNKRFGRTDSKLKRSLKKQIGAKQVMQKKLLHALRTEAKRLEQQTVSMSGLEQLSTKSIMQIHKRQKQSVERLSKTVDELTQSYERRIFLENELVHNRHKRE